MDNRQGLLAANVETRALSEWLCLNDSFVRLENYEFESVSNWHHSYRYPPTFRRDALTKSKWFV